MTKEIPQLNILVVDDDEAMQMLVYEWLGSQDSHNVVMTGSVGEALECMLDYSFNVAFVDQNLPGRDGIDLCEHLVNLSNEMYGSYIQTALMTGSVDEAVYRRAARMQIPFLRKPFEKTDLVNVIERYHEHVGDMLRPLDDKYAPTFDNIGGALIDTELGSVVLSERNSDRLVGVLRNQLSKLMKRKRYNEHRRGVVVGLLNTAAMLNLTLKVGETSMYRQYDDEMDRRGYRREFEWMKNSDRFGNLY